MIDNTLEVGNQVRFIGNSSYWEVAFGELGIITEVDGDDANETYRVTFPRVGEPKWFYNRDLESVKINPVEDTVCGWQARALKAEAEIKELKQALKTLSEG